MESDLHKLRIVRRAEVLHLTGLSRATLYRLIGEDQFPGPLRISHQAVGWRESEIRAWLESRDPVRASAVPSSEEADPGGSR